MSRLQALTETVLGLASEVNKRLDKSANIRISSSGVTVKLKVRPKKVKSTAVVVWSKGSPRVMGLPIEFNGRVYRRYHFKTRDDREQFEELFSTAVRKGIVTIEGDFVKINRQ